MDEEEEEEEEQWLLESLRLYGDLHLFELQDPTRVIEWTGDTGICVAGYGHGRRHEVLRLRLPPRLSARESQGLCPERDFTVEHGGFSERPVYQLKHVPGTSLLVTSGPPDGLLQVWRMAEEETDAIKLVGTIQSAHGDERSWAKVATTSAKPARVLHGLRVSDVRLTEIESGRTIFVADSGSPDEIATLDFLDEATGLACSARGQLFCVDTRQPRAPLGAAAEAPAPAALGGHRWCAGVSRSAGDKPLVARLSSGGHVVLTDIRSAASPVQAAQCPVPTAGPQGGEFQSVSFAPLLGGCLAVSGFDAAVRVYDTQSWGPSGRSAEPAFVHRGHLFGSAASAGHPPLVTTHTWHPSKPRTVLSAATDGSLHVWDWSDPHGAS